MCEFFNENLVPLVKKVNKKIQKKAGKVENYIIYKVNFLYE